MQKRDTPLIKKLLNHPVASEFLDLERKYDFDETPLILACRFGVFEIADLLIDKGANVKAVAKNNVSALHYCAVASGEDSFKTAKTIFEKSGKDINFLKADDIRNSVAVNCCRENGNHQIFEMVIDECDNGRKGYDPDDKKLFLSLACLENNTKTVGVLLRKGLNLDSANLDILKGHKKEPANNNSSQQSSGAESLKNSSNESSIQPSSSTNNSSAEPLKTKKITFEVRPAT